MVISDEALLFSQLEQIIRSGATPISNIRPSDWTEANVVMGKPFPGMFQYSRTPYTREIIDRLAPDDPARVVAVKKGAQVGFSAGVIYPGVAWMIKNAPGNSVVTVGAPDLIDKAVEKMDLVIDNSGLRPYIRPSVLRNRANKSGDTNTKKDFSGGYTFFTTPNNHKQWRQMDLQYGWIDDYESAKAASKESGSTLKMIMQRFAAYADQMKLFLISTPELLATSNIEPAYLMGDQRKYLVPCPCCQVLIEWKWTVELDGGVAGITWKQDDAGKLIPGSVGYICQECGGFFNDKKKHQMLNDGLWQPTAIAQQPGYYSYHLSSLYAPIGMFGWDHYVQDYLQANPPGQPRDEKLYQTFVNLGLGECYEGEKASPEAKSIQKNSRAYEIGTIPESLSIADGNGRIVLLTLAADMNGVMEEGREDVRLDYEVVAWAENGATYSVVHGSLGTFVPRENTLKHKADRERWTYEFGKERSVWPLLDLILQRQYATDTGRAMNIIFAGLDCGFFSNTYAYPYLDRTNSPICGLKGNKEGKYTRFGIDVPLVKPAQERDNLWMLEVGLIKDKLADYMKLRWYPDQEESQPPNFMNFPHAGRYICPAKAAFYAAREQEYAGDELYGFNNYFSHFEAEHRVETKNTDGTLSFRWVKKSSTVLNHSFDVRIYNIAMREVMLRMFEKSVKKGFTWKDYVAMAAGGE
jgi:phage terminase large subunit GpA-like protein